MQSLTQEERPSIVSPVDSRGEREEGPGQREDTCKSPVAGENTGSPRTRKASEAAAGADKVRMGQGEAEKAD